MSSPTQCLDYIVKIEQSRPYARLTGVRLNIYNGERIREI
jgi:hypothetical protein